jgi:hypothetical protein
LESFTSFLRFRDSKRSSSPSAGRAVVQQANGKPGPSGGVITIVPDSSPILHDFFDAMPAGIRDG